MDHSYYSLMCERHKDATSLPASSRTLPPSIVPHLLSTSRSQASSLPSSPLPKMKDSTNLLYVTRDKSKGFGGDEGWVREREREREGWSHGSPGATDRGKNKKSSPNRSQQPSSSILHPSSTYEPPPTITSNSPSKSTLTILPASTLTAHMPSVSQIPGQSQFHSLVIQLGRNGTTRAERAVVLLSDIYTLKRCLDRWVRRWKEGEGKGGGAWDDKINVNVKGNAFRKATYGQRRRYSDVEEDLDSDVDKDKDEDEDEDEHNEDDEEEGRRGKKLLSRTAEKGQGKIEGGRRQRRDLIDKLTPDNVAKAIRRLGERGGNRKEGGRIGKKEKGESEAAGETKTNPNPKVSSTRRVGGRLAARVTGKSGTMEKEGGNAKKGGGGVGKESATSYLLQPSDDDNDYSDDDDENEDGDSDDKVNNETHTRKQFGRTRPSLLSQGIFELADQFHKQATMLWCLRRFKGRLRWIRKWEINPCDVSDSHYVTRCLRLSLHALLGRGLGKQKQRGGSVGERNGGKSQSMVPREESREERMARLFHNERLAYRGLTVLYLRAHRPARKHALQTPGKSLESFKGGDVSAKKKEGKSANSLDEKKKKKSRRFHHLVTGYLISHRNNLEEAYMHASSICKKERDLTNALYKWNEWVDDRVASNSLITRGEVLFFDLLDSFKQFQFANIFYTYTLPPPPI